LKGCNLKASGDIPEAVAVLQAINCWVGYTLRVYAK